MDKQDLYTLCTLIPPMDDYSGHNMYLCGKRDGFNECVQTLKENLESISEEQGHDQFQKWIDEHALSYINVLERPSVPFDVI